MKKCNITLLSYGSSWTERTTTKTMKSTATSHDKLKTGSNTRPTCVMTQNQNVQYVSKSSNQQICHFYILSNTSPLPNTQMLTVSIPKRKQKKRTADRPTATKICFRKQNKKTRRDITWSGGKDYLFESSNWNHNELTTSPLHTKTRVPVEETKP